MYNKYKVWNKKSIDSLLNITLTNNTLKILDNYIQWYKKNNNEKLNMYSIDNLKHIYCLIHNDLYYDDIQTDYIKILHYLDNKNTIIDYSSFIIIIIIFLILFLIKCLIYQEQKYIVIKI